MGQTPSISDRLDVTGTGFSQDDLPELDHGPLDLPTWFKFASAADYSANGDTAAAISRDRAFDLEIGSGKGTFLVQQAGLEPDVDFLGIEWSKKFWRLAADRARRHGLLCYRRKGPPMLISALVLCCPAQRQPNTQPITR